MDAGGALMSHGEVTAPLGDQAGRYRVESLTELQPKVPSSLPTVYDQLMRWIQWTRRVTLVGNGLLPD